MNSKDVGMSAKSKFTIGIDFSWNRPIEQELLSWARYMRSQNLMYRDTTIWGRKQKREAEIYVNAFKMFEERILLEMKIREHATKGERRGDTSPPTTNHE